MEALMQRGVKLSVVEMGDRMVPRMMGPMAGGMIRDWCETQGVQVFTGTKVEAIEPGIPLKVRLSNGQTVEADLVISATGVKPHIGFCLLYTSDAADDLLCVDLGGRRIIKKKK